MSVANIYRTSAFGPAIPPRLVSGGFALFANGTGTASFDSFRVTTYPDSSVSLLNAGRATNSLVNWNGNFPAGTSVTVQTSTDNGITWQNNAGSGAPIAGISTLLYTTRSLQKQPDMYLPLDDSSSATAQDLSGHGNTGTISGSMVFGVPGPLQGPAETTFTGMTFNGTNAEITLPSGLNPTTGPFSLVCWVNNPSPSGNHSLFANWSSNLSFTQNYGAGIGMHNGAADFEIVDNTYTFRALMAPSPLASGWHMLVGTWDGSTMYLFVDGQLVLSQALASITPAVTPLIIGSSYYADFVAASIAQCATYSGNNILLANDVLALYNAGLAAVGSEVSDSFTANTSANYTQTNGSGGSGATWAWDTVNSRVSAAGGSKAVLLYNNFYASDTNLLADFYQSENGGLIWGWQDSNHYYELLVKDSGAGSSPNTMTLNKYAANLFASDSFTRANQSGWGTSSDSESWSFSGASSTNSIASNEGVIKSNGNNDTHAQLGSGTATDQEVLCRIAIGDNTSDVCGVQGRFTSSGGTSGYKLLYYSGGIHINKAITGTNTNLANTTFTMVNNTFYWFRLTCSGTTISGKVWQNGSTEPANPNVGPVTDGSIASGGFAVLANTSSTNGIQFDHFQANTTPSLSQLATANITFTAQTHHLVHVTMLSGIITASFDENTILTYTDGSPFPAGLAGLRNDTGTSYVYLLQITPQPVSVSNQYLCVKHTLSTTDPTVTPQITDHQALVSDPTLGIGALVPSADYSQKYVSDNIDDLNTKSNYWWQVSGSKVIFQPTNATDAPYILQSSDIFIGGSLPTVEYSGDMYRNQQVLEGVYDTSTFVEIKAGDGSSRTWNVANPIVAPPTIVLNGLSATVGIQGKDTGKQFYYQLNSTAITQDNSQPILQKDIDAFLITYTGSYSIEFVLDNTGQFSGTVSQAQMAAIDGTSGIVSALEDVSSRNMNLSAATDYANQLLQRFGTIGSTARTITFQTLHSGLKPGQSLPIFVPVPLNIFDGVFLVVQVETTIRTTSNGTQYVYAIIASEAAALSSWIKFFSKVLRSVTGSHI